MKEVSTFARQLCCLCCATNNACTRTCSDTVHSRHCGHYFYMLIEICLVHSSAMRMVVFVMQVVSKACLCVVGASKSLQSYVVYPGAIVTCRNLNDRLDKVRQRDMSSSSLPYQSSVFNPSECSETTHAQRTSPQRQGAKLTTFTCKTQVGLSCNAIDNALHWTESTRNECSEAALSLFGPSKSKAEVAKFNSCAILSN